MDARGVLLAGKMRVHRANFAHFQPYKMIAIELGQQKSFDSVRGVVFQL